MSHMTLDDWLRLTPDDRNRRRRDWPREGGLWIELIAEAAHRFKLNHGNHPLVHFVGHDESFTFDTEPAIHVTTGMWSPQRIETLPDRHLTFLVVQHPIYEKKHAVLKSWDVVLKDGLRWPSEKIAVFAGKWEPGLNGADGGKFYTEPAMWYILPAIIPPHYRDLVAKVPEQLRDLALRLEVAMDDHGNAPLDADNFDRAAAVNRLRSTLESFIEALLDGRTAT
jgi:hypothetical protein